jgi:hypothetical protein
VPIPLSYVEIRGCRTKIGNPIARIIIHFIYQPKRKGKYHDKPIHSHFIFRAALDEWMRTKIRRLVVERSLDNLRSSAKRIAPKFRIIKMKKDRLRAPKRARFHVCLLKFSVFFKNSCGHKEKEASSTRV